MEPIVGLQHAYELELKLQGPGITLRTVRAAELADMLRAIEAALADILEVEPAQIVLGLVGVRESSACYALSATEAVRDAYQTFARVAATGDASHLPESTMEAHGKVLAFVRRNSGTVQYYSQGESLATLTPESTITRTPPNALRGETTLYGHVRRVGGDPPKVRLRVAGSERAITCETTEAIARQAAHHLYEWIGLRGRGEWHPDTLALLGFRIESIEPFRQSADIEDALTELAGLAVPGWADSIDVLADVIAIRDGDT